jgi:hypothetical protein
MDGVVDWYYFEDGVDASNGVSLSFTKPGTGYKTVNVTSSDGSYVVHQRHTAEIWFEMNGSGETFEVYDPNEDDFVFGDMVHSASGPDPEYEHTTFSLEATPHTVTDSQDITLPTATVTPPADNVHGSTLAYDTATGTISFDAVTGANMYVLQFGSASEVGLGSVWGLPDSALVLDPTFVTDALVPYGDWMVSILAYDAAFALHWVELSQVRGSQNTVMVAPGSEWCQISDFADPDNDGNTSGGILQFE